MEVYKAIIWIALGLIAWVMAFLKNPYLMRGTAFTVFLALGPIAFILTIMCPDERTQP